MTHEKWFILSENELKKINSYFVRFLRDHLDTGKNTLKLEITLFINKHNISSKFSIERVQETT